jgi:hypothetical protein
VVILRTVITLLAIVTLAACFVWIFYHTDLGLVAARIIPDAFWLRFHEILGTTSAEAASDADLFFFTVVSLGLAGILVGAGRAIRRII